MTFADTLKGTKEGSEKIIDIDDPALIDEIGEEKNQFWMTKSNFLTVPVRNLIWNL